MNTELNPENKSFQHQLPGLGEPVEVNRFGGSIDFFYQSVMSCFSPHRSVNGEFTETRAVFDVEGKKSQLLVVADYFDDPVYQRLLFVKVEKSGLVSGTQLLMEHDNSTNKISVREIDITKENFQAFGINFDPNWPVVSEHVMLENVIPERILDPDEDLFGLPVDEKRLNEILEEWGIPAPPQELKPLSDIYELMLFDD